MTDPFSPFPDPDAPYAGSQVQEFLPESMGGPIEAVKTAVILALRDAITGTSMRLANSKINVDMEYPLELTQYPGIWVQFSLTKLQRAGLAHEVMTSRTVNEGTPEEYINWEPVQEWAFEGRVTMTIVALTSLERDKIADMLVAMLAFSRPPMRIRTKPQDTKEHKTLLTELANNPYIYMTLNTDQIIIGGQSMAQAPFDPENILTYEDNYSMDMVGQFAIKFQNDGLFTLARIDEVQTMADRIPNPVWNPWEWH